ncbi:MAG: tryptophan 7-halogenase [Xanthomonadales bacterium]|nr:tryptophan 7-halogenase [Xanthomonadales bacterium]
MEQAIKDIIVVGGGTAGWMTAAALARCLNREAFNIRLIESDQIGIVGVGEATIPAIHEFNQLLGIDEKEFMRQSNATFKLGIEFCDWANKGDSYIHPFAAYGVPMEGVEFHHYWLRMRGQGDQAAFADYSLPITAARAGRFDYPSRDPRSPKSTYRYAFHFDAALYARYLRGWAEQRGVQRIEGKIVGVNQNGETGFIETVSMENGDLVSGDLFVDCSGFRALLIEQAMNAGYDDWSHWLPCNRAAAMPTENDGEPAPHTRARALTAGWQWKIPLQHRTGNGHVYCSDYLSDDEAVSLLRENVDGEPLAEPRLLRFTAGRRKQAWVKNCVAIGLSGGFLEPLESTSIYLIQSAIMKLIRNLPDASFKQVEIDEFNRQMNNKFEQVRDLLILHYKQIFRDDTPFWNYTRNMEIPEELAHRMALFKHRGVVAVEQSELFSEPSWLAVLLGQGLVPDSYDPRANVVALDELTRRMTQIRSMIAQAADSMPSHLQTIKAHCASDSIAA